MTIILLAVALIPLIIFALISYIQFQRTLEANALHEVDVANQATAQNLKSFLLQYETDILSLSQNSAIHAIIQATDNGGIDPESGLSYEIWAQRLTDVFAEVSKRKRTYQQLRYLDEHGYERVRVNFDPITQKINIVSSAELQDKSQRDYFIEAAKLKSDQIYISQVDLNRDHDQIQVPHTPVLRYAVPLFNQAGKFKGLVISNVYASHILNLLVETPNDRVEVYLANQNGYYLHHPNPEVEFGFDLGLEAKLTQDFSWIMSQAKGQDIIAAIDPQTRRVMAVQKIYYDTQRPDHYWFLAKSLPGEAVLADINVLGGAIFSLVIVVMLATIFLSVWLAGTITTPIRLLAEATARIAQGDLKAHLLVKGQDEIGQLAHNFELMTQQIQSLVDNLEERINDRTQALETSAEISRKIATMLDLDELLRYVIERIQQDFNFYHCHLYLMDELAKELIMVEGSGEVGQQLKAKQHRLPVGQGIVGRVALSGQSFLADDVDAIPYFFRNPLLPKTKSELAIPLRKGSTVIGVLDMQSEELGGFNQADLTLMQSIADQVAVAIDNVRLFQRNQTALVAVEALNRRLTQTAWQNIAQKTAAAGYVFTKQEVQPIKDKLTQWLSTMTTAIKQRDLVYSQPSEVMLETVSLDEPTTSVSIPLMLREEVIGVIGIERKAAAVWTKDELVMIRTLAEQVALALDAARLFDDTQRNAWRDQMISETTAKVWASNKIEEVMRAAVAQLGNKLGASEVTLELHTDMVAHEAKPV